MKREAFIVSDKFMNEFVTINVHPLVKRASRFKRLITVGVNGENVYVFRGENMRIRRKYVAALAGVTEPVMRRKRYTVRKRYNKRGGHYGYRPVIKYRLVPTLQTKFRFPLIVVRDTRIGRKWFKELVQ